MDRRTDGRINEWTDRQMKKRWIDTSRVVSKYPSVWALRGQNLGWDMSFKGSGGAEEEKEEKFPICVEASMSSAPSGPLPKRRKYPEKT